MSDRLLPIGQYMPPMSRSSVDATATSASNSKAGDLSFQNMLVRQQLSSAKLRSIPQASVPQSTYTNRVGIAKNLPNTPTPSATTGEIELTSQSGGPVAMDSKWLQQSSELIRSMPQEIPQGSEFDKQLLQNFREYQTMKQTASSSEIPDSQGVEASPPPIIDAMAAYSRNNKPISSELSDKPEVTIGAFNSILSEKNGNESPAAIVQSSKSNKLNRVNRMKGKAESADSAVSTSESTYKKTSASRTGDQSKISSSDESSNTTKTEKSLSRGFFGAIGSFFCDLASGLTLGIYRPAGEPEPTGMSRVIYPLKKLVFDAPIQDLAVGAPVGLVNTVSSPFRKTKSSASASNESTTPTEKTTPSRSSRSRLLLDGYRPVSVSRIPRSE